MKWSDTEPKVKALLIEGYRQMSAEEKLRKVDELNKFLVTLIEAEARSRCPNANEREVRLRVASRWLTFELMKKGFRLGHEREGLLSVNSVSEKAAISVASSIYGFPRATQDFDFVNT